MKILYAIVGSFLCVFLFAGIVSAATTLPTNQVLKNGSKGTQVVLLQKSLNTLGYSIKEDGIYGNSTKQTVISLQSKYGLTADGITGKQTLSVINQLLSGKKVSTPSVSGNVKVAPTNNYWIVVNKSTNRLTLYKGKQAVKTYKVATGRKSDYTPEGKFTLVTKYVNPAWGGGGYAKPIKGGAKNNPLGVRWMGINARGTSGGTYGIHGNSNPSSIGTYASAGCVRMYNNEVIELYSKVPKGTPVWIGTNSKLKSYGL